MVEDVPPALTIRPYGREGDARATYGVFRAAITRTAASDYTPAQIAAWAGPEETDLDGWHRRRAAPRTWVAEVAGGRVVGFADLLPDGLLDMLYVDPDHGRRGIARRLVATVQQEAAEAGLTELRTHASRTARPLFEACGFRVVRARPDNRVRGQVVPNDEMRCELRPDR